MTSVVRLDGLGHGYGTVEVLADVSLALPPGSYASITGPSGSGKSTLLHLLALLERPRTGSYHLLGQDVSRLSDDERARIRGRSIGLVFQQFHLLPNRTALENVLLPLRYRGDVRSADFQDQAVALLRRFSLGHRLLARAGTLSGGEQQRVAVARALLSSPGLVLADEPTGNLDRSSGGQAIDALESAVDDGRCLVVVTHDETVARRARIGYELVDGRLKQVRG